MVRYAAVAVVLGLIASPLYAQEVLFTVTKTVADVHVSPSTGSPVIGRAPRGETFEVSRDLGSWVRIPWPAAPDGVAYLHVTWGTISGGTAAETRPIRATRTDVPRPASESVSPPATLQVTQQPRATTVPRAANPLLPSHTLGFGGRIGGEAFGVAATGRAWSRGPVGVQIEIGRSTHTSALVSDQVNTMQFSSSLIYSPPDLVTNAIWVRPYLGAGLSIYRSTLITLPPGVSVPTDKGLGYQAFWGAEFTWANIPQLTVSGDLRQQWAPRPFSGFQLGGFGFSMSAHWYVK